MRVMQVLYSGLGGHGSVVTSLINADKKEEWKHSLLFYGIEEMLPSYKEFCIEKKIPFLFVQKKKGLFKTGWLTIRRAFKQHDPDIIILHSPTLIFPAWNFCLFRKKKLFVVEHTPHATKRISEKISSFFALLVARKIVCLSSDYRQQLKKQFRFLPVQKRTVVVQNGIDLETFRPVEKPVTAEMHIGMIGRFSIQKNQAMIIEAAEKGLLSGQLNETVHFHFAGDGETLVNLEKKVKEKKLDKVIHFYGLLNEGELKKLLDKLHVYVHASYAETMCTSVMQAMACGLPVLGSDIPGINDVVINKENALLFNNNDINELIKKLVVMKNKAMREEMGSKSRRIAVQNFSSFETFNKYHCLIKQEKK
jgi:glycosyltransferase involved in cell wall biosynthesis